MRPSAHPLLWKRVLFALEYHFDIKGLALNLVLIQRLGWNLDMAYWLTGAGFRNLLNLVLVHFPASTLPARAFICRWFNEPLSGYLRTSFSSRLSIKSSVSQRNRRISRIVLRSNTTERARATTTTTKETRTYKEQQVSNQSRFPRVTVCFDRCKKFHVLKERRCIHPKCFSCSPANYTWSERNFRAISLLKFVSKRLVLKPISSSQEEINTKGSVLTNGQGISRYIYKAYLTGTTKLTNQIYYETWVRKT